MSYSEKRLSKLKHSLSYVKRASDDELLLYETTDKRQRAAKRTEKEVGRELKS